MVGSLGLGRKIAKHPKDSPPAHLLHSSPSGGDESSSTSLPGEVKRQLTPTPEPMARKKTCSSAAKGIVQEFPEARSFGGARGHVS
eukprot:7367164-Karenia_brevis.AAC.1